LYKLKNPQKPLKLTIGLLISFDHLRRCALNSLQLLQWVITVEPPGRESPARRVGMGSLNGTVDEFPKLEGKRKVAVQKEKNDKKKFVLAFKLTFKIH